MIKHIVCYKLKDPSPETLAKMKELFLSMRGRVPELKEVTAGIDALKSPRSYDVVLEAKFDSFEDCRNSCIPSSRRACPWTTNAERRRHLASKGNHRSSAEQESRRR